MLSTVRLFLGSLLLVAAAVASPAPVDKTWPQFRGHAGRGVSAIDNLPTNWSATTNVVWKANVPGRGWSSPIVWGDQVRIYQARVGGAPGHTFSASPWTYGGRIFCMSEDGDTFVLQPGDRYDEVARNSLGAMTLASPAITRDGVFIRTVGELYRIR